MIKSFGTIGYGVVGQATTGAFIDHAEFVGWVDPGAEHDEYQCDSVAKLVAANPDLIFVCVWAPTNMGTGAQNIAEIENVLGALEACEYEGIVAIKTTILPQHIEYLEAVSPLQICAYPEFLTEANAFEDAKNPAMNVLGGSLAVGEQMLEFVLSVWPDVPIRFLSCADAMHVKYRINCFLACKVALFNEFAILKQGSFDAITDAMKLDPRIGASHTQVPGPDGERGFGGKCLPKDLIAYSYANNNPYMLTAAWSVNQSTRDRADWTSIAGAVE